jgi:DNA modification methylase
MESLETSHEILVEDSRSMSALPANSVDLVVTSPPYPMVEMWDDLFASLDPAVAEALDDGDGPAAYRRMHDVLTEVWAEVARVLVDGGIACVNVGDATRKVDETFRVYQNHAAVVDAFEALGFDPLPDILWRKPVNSGTKFMGSGMVPPNAYATLEHEYVLVFRNGSDGRSFEPRSERRYNSAYFWEERNRWFSDVWTDVTGELQSLEHDDLRGRSAAFPFEIPYRLVNMYSLYGDTVLDPFWGTGTTSLAAMVAGRNSVGFELDAEFTEVFAERVADVPALSRRVIERRLAGHRSFVEELRNDGDRLEYEAEHYDFPVRTKQERRVRFFEVADVEATDAGYELRHEHYGAE